MAMGLWQSISPALAQFLIFFQLCNGETQSDVRIFCVVRIDIFAPIYHCAFTDRPRPRPRAPYYRVAIVLSPPSPIDLALPLPQPSFLMGKEDSAASESSSPSFSRSSKSSSFSRREVPVILS